MQIEEISHKLHPTTLFVNNVPKDIKFHPTVQDTLKNIITKEGYTSHKIFKRMISSNGSNFLGDLYEINIKGETEDGRKETNIFLKHAIPDNGMDSIIDTKNCYARELFFYNELRNVFNALQEEVDIPEKERFKIVKSYDECNTNAVILDNLSKRGFKSLRHKDVMSLKFAKQSMVQLAKLHGLSFALKHKKQEYFERKVKTIHSMLKFHKEWEQFVERQFDITYGYFDNETQKKIEAFLYTLYEKLPKYFRGETDSVRCFCHGDFRLSNVMVKENDKEEDEIFVIDYQLSFYGSPVTDILFFIYTGTDRKFRDAHLNYLKNVYHSTLADYLKYFDLDISNVYPKNIFEKDFNDSLDFGLMVALSILPICFTAEGEVPDFSKDSVDDIVVKVDGRFKDRITEIVEDYINCGILK